MSKYKSTDSETSLRAEGLNLAIAPKTLLVKKVVTDAEVICAELEKDGKKEEGG